MFCTGRCYEKTVIKGISMLTTAPSAEYAQSCLYRKWKGQEAGSYKHCRPCICVV